MLSKIVHRRCKDKWRGVASYWRSFQTVGHVKRVEVHNLLSPKENTRGEELCNCIHVVN